MAALGGNVPCAPVYGIADALENPFLLDRAGVVTTAHSNRTDLKNLQSPVRMTDPIPNQPGPCLGADTYDILREPGAGIGITQSKETYILLFVADFLHTPKSHLFVAFRIKGN